MHYCGGTSTDDCIFVSAFKCMFVNCVVKLAQEYKDSKLKDCVFTFVSEFRQNSVPALRFWCIKCTNPKGECTGQALQLKRKYMILSNSRAQSKCTVINLIHKGHERTFSLFMW